MIPGRKMHAYLLAMEICSKELGYLYDIGDRQERRWQWLGHVLRMPPFSLSLSLSLCLSLNSLPRVALLQEKRNRGRS